MGSQRALRRGGGGVVARRTSRTVAVLAAVLAAAALLAGCSGSADDDPSAPASHDYLPGLPAFPHVPRGVTSAPVLVMIPGGAWRGADPTGLQPLAAALADRGVVAVPVHIRTAGDGVVFPVPVDDVLCALADGVATARAAGIEPTRVALLGHSSGAHLASVATLDPEQFAPHCEDPPRHRERLRRAGRPVRHPHLRRRGVGALPPRCHLRRAGRREPAAAGGPPPRRARTPPARHRRRRVPVTYSTDFAAALTAAGHPTTLTVLPGEDHDSIYDAQVVAPKIAEWLKTLPQD